MLDLVIRNAFIYDGSGMPGYLGEIGIKDGRIAQVGRVAARGATEIEDRPVRVHDHGAHEPIPCGHHGVRLSRRLE